MADGVHARIVYWGIAGSGKSSNLRVVYAKLKPGNRGELRECPTRLDPTITYEELPIELGEVGGHPTRLELVTVPSGAEHAPTRKQLLDEVAGIVIVIDAQRDRVDENIASVNELKNALASYGRTLAELPVVVQYNKRELSDPFAIEALHRQLSLTGAAAFEASASDGSGVLKTLTTVSKGVVRQLRGGGGAPQHVESPVEAPVVPSPAPAVLEPPAPIEAPVTEPNPVAESIDVAEPVAVAHDEPVTIDGGGPAQDEITDAVMLPELSPFDPEPDDAERTSARPGANAWMEDAILREAEAESAAAAEERRERSHPSSHASFEPSFEHFQKASDGARIGSDLEIVSFGETTRTGPRGLSVPVVLGNSEGETVTIALRIELDPLVDEPA